MSDHPTCCGRPMLPIVYGLPGPELMEESARGEVAIGGCLVSDDAPTFRCASCGREEGSLSPDDV